MLVNDCRSSARKVRARRMTGDAMAEVVEIPYRKIRGTKEWREAQEKLGEAWRTIQASLEDRGLIGRTIDNGEVTTENSEMLAREDRLSSANLVVMARRMRLAQLLEERGQVSRVMCQERRADGRRCPYPVSEGEAMCKAHAEWKAGPLALLPFPDDALGLQRLMAKLLSGLLYEKLDPLKARVAADVCRTMRQNLEGCAREAALAEEEMFL